MALAQQKCSLKERNDTKNLNKITTEVVRVKYFMYNNRKRIKYFLWSAEICEFFVHTEISKIPAFLKIC